VDKQKTIDAVKRFSESVCEAFDPEMIILYGSYAKGTQTESSDIVSVS
jgi:predicted nucleotidyltransferase